MSTEPKILSSRGKDGLATPSLMDLGWRCRPLERVIFNLLLAKFFSHLAANSSSGEQLGLLLDAFGGGWSW